MNHLSPSQLGQQLLFAGLFFLGLAEESQAHKHIML